MLIATNDEAFPMTRKVISCQLSNANKK